MGEVSTAKRAGITSYKELDVYRRAMDLAMEIFEVTKNFPKHEEYSLTNQIRRSSRSICSNLAEAWRKRRYPAAFISKISDSETEASETQVWLEFALRCGYMAQEDVTRLDGICNRVIAQLVTMIDQHNKWTFSK